MSTVYVTRCKECPCEYDGVCGHPGLVGEPIDVDAEGERGIPERCPLRHSSLLIELKGEE